MLFGRSSIFMALLRVLTKNFWLKLLSIMFALVIFFIVRTDKETVYERVAKIKIITPSDMVVIGPHERYLNVTVRLQNSLFSIPPQDNELVGEIHIPGENPQKMNIKIGRENFAKLPMHYDLNIDKPYLEVETDKLVEKHVVVRALVRGEPAPGLVVNHVVVKPEKIVVSGPAREMANIEMLHTYPVSIAGIENTQTTNVHVDMRGHDFLQLPMSAMVQVVISLAKKE